MNDLIMGRLSALREKMAANGIDYYLMPTSDYHNSEYSADFFKAREYFCGFTGSNGTLVVSADWAGMWTDGRYFIQAEREMEGTGVTLYKMGEEGVPTISEYLSENMKNGQVLGFDGKVVPAREGLAYEKKLKKNQVKIKFDKDLAGEVWSERPALPCNPIYVLSDELCGKSFADKLADIRKVMEEEKANAYLLCKLDDICWLTNLRGNDVECNPVILSYLFITKKSVSMFVQIEELNDEVRAYCANNGIEIISYDRIINWLDEYEYEGLTLYDERNVSYSVYRTIKDNSESSGANIKNIYDPTEMMKACKNETEIKNIREVYIKDSAVLTKFIYWVKNEVKNGTLNEYTAAMHLDEMRSQIPGFIELSFPTISAYKDNAAMMHYEATAQSNAELKPEDFLLVDSGATYMGGTTDVTRTIVLGPVSDEEKKHYTLTAVGMLQLANAHFLEGCNGRNLDILARQPLWNIGIDYKCGTGHGIGYMLNVHEGPHSIRWKSRSSEDEAPLKVGMIMSDEPGVYIEGKHGIRIENILEVVYGEKNSDGQFLEFRHLTYVPLDPDAIDKKYLQPREIDAINEYQKLVYDTISPLIEENEIKEWLKKQTRPIK
ncbi:MULTISPECIES: aminopeptidase P family protein [unclassified Butyrivibrio]|uniref:aminopeptidase P family protein n=1 Tax=unclassified Butyrivibrio TaxID=2639466 RepID=UPI00047A432D|nr:MULTISPECIES: aminopeptidase P family protein [unclassified Butyrivibrio]SEL50843.1 Xaa-Pro aminopeptidase [Butyrivibrio sp. ob235]